LEGKKPLLFILHPDKQTKTKPKLILNHFPVSPYFRGGGYLAYILCVFAKEEKERGEGD
jgi:hypothetical protein